MKKLKTGPAVLAALTMICAALTPSQAVAQTDPISEATKTSEALPLAPLIKRSAMMDRRTLYTLRLSPQGDRLAFTTRDGKLTKVWLHSLDTGETVHAFSSAMINGLSWTTDGSYLVLETDSGIAVAAANALSAPRHLVNIDRTTHEVYQGVDSASPHHVLVSLFNSDSESYTLTRVDMDGNQRALYTSKDKIYDFITAADGSLLFKSVAEGTQRVIYKMDGTQEREVYRCTHFDGCSIASYNDAAGVLYFYGRHGGDYNQLLSLEVDSGDIRSLTSDFSHPFDLEGVQFSPVSKTPMIAEYNTDYRVNHGLDNSAAQHIQTIKKALKSTYLIIRPTTPTHWFILDANPTRPTNHYWIYSVETGTLTRPLQAFIDDHRNADVFDNADHVSRRLPFWYSASDGFRLQGYLTLPRGTPIATAPMVVVPHGGPWNRVKGSFNSMAQLLANRGYVVFEPNFRSSTGLGKSYVTAANRDYGNGRVQQDIIDGTNYLLERGIGDREKLAIFGHSFGGFSVMNALTFTPDMFQVGIAGAPPPSFSRTIKYYIESQDQTRMGVLRKDIMALMAVDIDDPKDVARLYNQSPDKHVNKVVKPMYIIAGEKDRRVNILDVRDYAIRLEENGVKVTLLADKKEGHNFRNPIATQAYTYMVENALAHHLGGRIEPITNSKVKGYLKRNLVMGSLN